MRAYGASEIADETRRLVKSGTLRGVSIGFMPKPGRMRVIDRRDTGWWFEEIELLEV